MIKFKTGRSDCTEFESAEESYKATKHESHPNAVGNGQQTKSEIKRCIKLCTDCGYKVS